MQESHDPKHEVEIYPVFPCAVKFVEFSFLIVPAKPY